MRSLTIAGNSLYMRIFLWAWPVNPATLNICKLFWGTILFPVAFCNFTWKIRGVPRISYLYAGLGVVFAIYGAYIGAALFLVAAIIIAVVAYFVKFKQKDRLEQKDRLAITTGRASTVADWIANWIDEHILNPTFDLADNVHDSRVGEKLGGFFSIVRAYYRSLKERTCLKVEVV